MGSLIGALAVLLAACGPSRAPVAPRPKPVTIAWHFSELLTIDLRTCEMTLEQHLRMPRSGTVDREACASLRDRSFAVAPRAPTSEECGHIAPKQPSFTLHYADGATVSGPRCLRGADDLRNDEELMAALRRLRDGRTVAALRSSGATPPGECDAIDCGASGLHSDLEIAEKSKLCADGRSLRIVSRRCLRQRDGKCAVSETVLRACPP